MYGSYVMQNDIYLTPTLQYNIMLHVDVGGLINYPQFRALSYSSILINEMLEFFCLFICSHGNKMYILF